MNSEDLDVYKRIDEILWIDWDPIGLNHMEDPRGEYRGYLWPIYNLKKEKAEIEAIAKQLYLYETENMGLSGNFGRCIEVAKKINRL